MIAINAILALTDFSEPSKHGLRYALGLAQTFGAKVYVLHVMEHPPLDHCPDDYERLEREIEDVLATTVPESMRAQLEIESEIRRGKPFIEIIQFAREREVDLIVMATHGRTGIRHALMGSTTEQVIRTSPCPVLTVKTSEHEPVTAS